jgi:hypothetical protein
MTKKEEFEAEVNEIDALVYIPIDYGEKGPPNSQLDQDNDDKSITPRGDVGESYF